jgi:DNA adenine methylase
MNFYGDQDHRELAQYVQEQDEFKWVMSYDDTNFIRNLYATCEISHLSLEYSLQRRREAQELLISPSGVILPDPASSTNRV